jgi:glucosamine--fructose-6-phosphate aminotransferase (isomerizing)
MCGIVGAVSTRDITPILVEGLKRLEYRGYDSCGVAVYQDGGLRRARSVERVAELDRVIEQDKISGFTGIAHTRWATHGAPTTSNAHPHFSSFGSGEPRIALVHNGIIENHEALRTELQAAGYVFVSQTDTEVIAHLLSHLYKGDLLVAFQQTVARLQGAYGIAAFCKDPRVGCDISSATCGACRAWF